MSFADALADYRREGEALFKQVGRAALEDDRPDPVTGADGMLVHSQELERTAGLDLASGDADVRELAAVQLAAAAALDLAAAADTLRLGGGAEAAALDEDAGGESEFMTTYAQLRGVLEAETALGARQAFDTHGAGGGEPAALEEDDDPVAGLREAVKTAVSKIADDAAAIGGHAIDGLVELPQDALLSAFGEAADKLLGHLLNRAKRLVRTAIKHVVKAASKLLRLLGKHEKVARAWLAKKLGGVTRDKLVEFAVDRVLEVDRLRDELDAALAGPGQAPDEQLEAARREVGSLADRFGRHELVIRVLANLLGKVRSWLLGLAAWAAAAVAGVYVLMLAYGVWVAGDFLDWYRTETEGRLDLVSGVRSVVLGAVETATL